MERAFKKMGKFLNLLENHIGFCTKGLSKKDSLDGDSFLQTTYGEWLCSKKNNAKNYFVLPKDSKLSKKVRS